MLIGRRAFLTGFMAAGVAAPLIVRPGILMPVKPLALDAGDLVWTHTTLVEARYIVIYGVDQFGNKVLEHVDLGGVKSGSWLSDQIWQKVEAVETSPLLAGDTVTISGTVRRIE